LVERRINGFAAIGLQILEHQIKKAIAGLKSFAIENQLEAGVQVAVMAQPPLDVLAKKLNFFENRGVGLEPDKGSVRLVGRFAFLLVFDFALLEKSFDKLPFAKTADGKLFGEGIDCLGADAVQAHAE